MADPLGPISAHPDRAGILLDFDGTLAPIVARPEDVGLAPGAKELLESLVSRYALVAVISGRPPEALVELVGVNGVRYEGLYGLSRCGIDQTEVILTIADAEQRMLKNLLRGKFPDLEAV